MSISKKEAFNSIKKIEPFPISLALAERSSQESMIWSHKPKIIQNEIGRASLGISRGFEKGSPYKSLEKIYSTKKKSPVLTYSNWTKNFDHLGSSRLFVDTRLQGAIGLQPEKFTGTLNSKLRSRQVY
jgi:hypothetical protein